MKIEYCSIKKRLKNTPVNKFYNKYEIFTITISEKFMIAILIYLAGM